MAYDGVVISSIINEIGTSCKGGRVLKVQQPSADVITITVKGYKGQTKLYLSASPSLPIVYVADTLPQAPMQAPAFCMLLRKHLANGRLVDIKQPNFDRVFDFIFEHMDEMGDISDRHLIVEIMGRQSNIILADNDLKIIDCLRRVMPDLSDAISKDSDNEIRILYPGQQYSAPDSQGKINPLTELDKETFDSRISSQSGPVVKAIFSTITGFSKGFAEEIVYASGIDGRASFSDLDGACKERLYETILGYVNNIKEGKYSPCIGILQGLPKDFHAFEMKRFDELITLDDLTGQSSDAAMSQFIIRFYEQKQRDVNIRSKSSDIKKVLQTAIERASKKYDIQLSQLKSTEDRDKFRIYGELINTYGYELKGGEKSLSCVNYYDGQEITIPLDTNLSAQENSQKYFAKYNKKKRTFEALTEFVKKTREERDYLLTIKHSLDIAEDDSDIQEIRKELQQAGVLKSRSKEKGSRKQSAGKPLHFLSSEGYDIYVGKNNIQNEELTFGLATGKDIWFHAKNMPGSHVIVKVKDGDMDFDSIPDSVFEEAAQLAAYYSSGSSAPKVEVDYTERKHLKKPPHANPGYVIYHTNYSMMVKPEKGNVTKQED